MSSPTFNDQVAQLKARFLALQPRDRFIVAAGIALMIVVTIYSAALSPLYKSVSDRTTHVTQKQQDLAWMQSMAPQLRALSNTRPISNPNESLVVVIASTAGRANIASSISGQTPSGNNSVRVRLDGVAFDALVSWLGILQSEFGISPETADVTHGAQPGQVNAVLTLTRVAN